MNPLRYVFALGSAACLVAGAHAQASFYSLDFVNAYTQTGATTRSYDGSYMGSSIETTNPGTYFDGSFSGPDSVVHDYTKNGSDYDFGTAFYGSPSDIKAAFPTGTYTMSLNLDAGGSSAETATIDDQVRWSSDVAMIAEYDALQNATAGQGFRLHLAGFTPGADTNDNLTFYDLVDVTTNTFQIVKQTTDSNAFDITIPAGMLHGGDQYAINIYYSSRKKVEMAGFTNATSFDIYDNLTTTRFTVAAVPEPSSWAALGLGAAALLRRRRK